MADEEEGDNDVVTIWDGSRAWVVPLGPVVYFVGTDPRVCTLVKIGHTVTPQLRLDQLRSGSPLPLHLIAITREYGSTEEAMHARFADLRAHGEWFDLGADPLGIIAARVGDLDEYAAACQEGATIPGSANGRHQEPSADQLARQLARAPIRRSAPRSMTANLATVRDVLAQLADGRARQARIALRVNQAEVASVLGVSRQALSHWESGRSVPSAPHALAYGRLLRQLARKAA